MEIEVEMEIEKETPGTYRYKETATGKPPVQKTLYGQKWAVGEKPPKRIKVSVRGE